MARGKVILEEIIDISRDFLDKFSEAEPEGIRAYESKRQELTEALQLLCSGLRSELSKEKDLTSEQKRLMDEFREYNDLSMRRIATIDSSIRSRAISALDSLRNDLAAISRGRKAVNGYGSMRRGHAEILDHTA